MATADDNVPTAMICDDDPFVVVVTRSILAGAGFEVTATAGSGEELQEALSRTAPDLLVLDQVLPDLSGERLVHTVNQVAPECRIILYSNMQTADGNPGRGVYARIAKRGTKDLTDAIGRAANEINKKTSMR